MRQSRQDEFQNRIGPVAGAILILALSVSFGGCSPAPAPVFEGPGGWSYDASADSLSLVDFLALTPGDQAQRRDLASAWKEHARLSRRLEEKVHALNNAGGLAPDDPTTWLELAGHWRWVGDYLQTIIWLDNAAAAVRKLGGGRETSGNGLDSAHWLAARQTGLLRGWLHYDRAEWREGLTWVNALSRRSPGDASIMRLRGLLAGGAARRSLALRMAEDIEYLDPFSMDGRWIRGALDRSRGLHSEAINYLTHLRPDSDHAAECWREMGEVAEMQRDYSQARRFYRESFHSLPFDDTSALAKISYPRLGEGLIAPKVEFWLAFDRFYVTGSLSAYTNHAWARYKSAVDPQPRDFWAGQVVNGAGILLRKEMDQPWALRIRGLVFLELNENEKALNDLRKCSRQLTELGKEDSRVEAGLGRLLLKKDRHSAGLPHLRKAVDLDPQNAGAWADLGLSLVMTGNVEGAKSALNRAIQMDPNSATAWYNRGLLRLRAGHFEEAESDLKEAARLAPGNMEVMELLQKAHSLQRNRTR